jgi:spoIIIJ-associated protein
MSDSTDNSEFTKLSEIPKEDLIDGIEEALSAISNILDIGLEYDFEISSYENSDYGERELLRVKLFAGEHESLLIGYHGQTLKRFQHIINLSLANKFKQRIRMTLDINDYRSRRERSLEGLARKTAREVVESGSEISLEPMTPNERRIIHNELNDSTEVVTESRGEGRDRRVVVLPANTEAETTEESGEQTAEEA